MKKSKKSQRAANPKQNIEESPESKVSAHNEPTQQSESARQFGWKTVDLKANANDEQDNMSSKNSAKRLKDNHYDNPSLQKRASRELEAAPQEALGIFFGLEVLSGDSYRLEQDPKNPTQRIMVPLDATKDQTKMGSGQGKSKKRPRTEHKPADAKDETVSPKQDPQHLEPQEDKSEKISKKQKRKREKKQEKIAQKKKEKQQAREEKKQSDASASTCAPDDETVQSMQTSWAAQTGGVSLHLGLCKSLVRQEFWSPTPIQAAVLPAAILGRRNIVGAAPTGSGKSLAFLLPIGQHLLEAKEKQVDGGEKNTTRGKQVLEALILTPTRELALQIKAESDKLIGPGMAETLVGGLAHVKQVRILEKKRPPILVSTPGRLWEMMSSHEYDHLNDLSQIRFLVIDEADRMVQQHSFPQLASILDVVQRANPMDDDDEEEDEDDDMSDDEDGDRLLGLPGIRGEAKLKMLNDDILAEIDRQRGTDCQGAKEVNNEEFEEHQAEEGSDGEDDSSLLSLPQLPPVFRQTFVYSATLTLPASSNFAKSKKSRFNADIDGAIAEILEKSRAKGKTKVVDLSNAKSGMNSMISSSDSSHKKADHKNANDTSKQKRSFRLPDGLTLQQIKCTQRHKDSHLYAYLMTTVEGSSGPCLVFCNSIAGARRVAGNLRVLGLDVRVLHAQMQQRARFKSVELLQESKKRTVVVATDVAARGLDIPSVASVVHYDAARSVDSFVHRSGRTARGMGPSAVGCSVSLVAPNEDKFQNNIAKALQIRFDSVAIDGRLMNAAHERVNLASKVAEVEIQERKSQQQNQWIQEKASEAGLDVDQDLLDEGLSGGNQRDRAKVQEAKMAQKRLQVLLSQPMQTQRFGKFLSTNSAAPANCYK